MRNIERNPLSKAVALLRWMSDSQVEQIGVRGVCRALGMAPSSAHRVIHSLTAEGLLEKDPRSGRYTFGLEFLRLAQKVKDRMPLRDIALPHMRRLVEACGEAAFVSMYSPERQEIVTVASVESNHTLRYVVELYTWKPVYVSAAGWAVMAYLSEGERAAIVARTKLAPHTENSITDAKQLERELTAVREKGYGLTRGQRIRGAVGLAAGLFNHTGAVFGGVGLSMPEQRFDPAQEKTLASLLMSCAQAITREAGGQWIGSKEQAYPGGAAALELRAGKISGRNLEANGAARNHDPKPRRVRA
jgi:DNA-binding IclR family transcriptional regulator